MNVRYFYTNGKRDLIEEEYDKPEPQKNQIEVKSVFTGVCRSDIAMYDGKFGPLPKLIQGHEGLGVVTKVGKNVSYAKEGDYVATRADHAFADYYNASESEIIVVPELHPKYILEPVACGLNMISYFQSILHSQTSILIIGSGFLATTIYAGLSTTLEDTNIDLIGSHNKTFWEPRVNMFNSIEQLSKEYEVIIDLSDNSEMFNSSNLLANNGIYIAGAQKKDMVHTDFEKLLWKAATIHFPSPRTPNFHHAMKWAKLLIKQNVIDTASLWTNEYNRSDVKNAFEDGLNRPGNYGRGYIKF